MSNFGGPPADAAVYVISVAAELTGLHPQTLRTYERMGLIQPGRTGGGGRRYSHADLELLRQIAELTGSGIGLEGVRRILELDARVNALLELNRDLAAELGATREALRQAQTVAAVGTRTVSRVPALRQSAGESSIVVWRRNNR